MKKLIVIFLLTCTTSVFAWSANRPVMTETHEMRNYKQDAGIYDTYREANKGQTDTEEE